METHLAVRQIASFWKVAISAIILGLIVNLPLAYLLHPLAPNLNQLSSIPVALWTLLGIIGALVVFAFMRRKQEHLAQRYLRVSVIVLLISFIPDIMIGVVEIPGFTGATMGGVLALMLLHITTACIALSFLLKFKGASSAVV